MAQLITISNAKANLPELARRNHDMGESFIILREGEPISALVPFEEYEAMLETLDILQSEPDIVKKLKQTQQEMAAGEFTVWKSKTQTKKKKQRTKKSSRRKN